MSDLSHPLKLGRDNAAVLLVDHQVGLVVGSRYPDPETRCRNSLGLVRAAQILGVPLVATTTMEKLFGPVFPELNDALSGIEILERSIIDPLEDPQVADAIVATNRAHLIIAGVFVSVCACFPAVSAQERGYRSYVAIDASAAADEVERSTAILRMTQAGVTVANYAALVVEMLADNADPRAQEIHRSIRRQYGVSALAALRSCADV
jgi:nicotinamidase-related amidase